jgi:exopolyphosphatase/guanosine-5'-triphosphate,3'-diphosphate pyrophosphatase
MVMGPDPKGRRRRRSPPFLSHAWRGRREGVFAALDLGTHNCRLLIARPGPGGFEVVDTFSRMVRLGAGLGETGRLGEAAVNRTLQALKVCAEKMRKGRVTASLGVATQACRQATNGAEFIARVKSETGLTLEIISAEEEARLVLDGCATLLDPAIPNALVFDIGGGSTEIIRVSLLETGEFAMRDFASFPYGVVTLTEAQGAPSGSDPIPAAAVEPLVSRMEALFAPFEKEHGLSAEIGPGRLQMLGTSGTITTLASVAFNLPTYDRSRIDGQEVSLAQIAAASRRLRDMSLDQLAAHPCIGRGRAGLVVAGCIILDAICRTWPSEKLWVADRGIREGILYRLMREAGLVGDHHLSAGSSAA